MSSFDKWPPYSATKRQKSGPVQYNFLHMDADEGCDGSLLSYKWSLEAQ